MANGVSGSSTQNPNTSGQSGPFSYNGGTTSDTFDPKAFGTKMLQDTSTAYGQGPKVNPSSGYTPYSAQTSGLIDRGLSDITAQRGGAVGDVASGAWLGGDKNPFFEKGLQHTRDNIMKDVGAGFTNSGRFGGGSYVDQATTSIGNSENAARSNNFNDEYNRMIGAQGSLQAGNAQGLGFSGLLDSKAAEKTAADNQQWDATNNANYNHIAKYLNLINGGGDPTKNNNAPTSIWDILGTVGNVGLKLFGL